MCRAFDSVTKEKGNCYWQDLCKAFWKGFDYKQVSTALRIHMGPTLTKVSFILYPPLVEAVGTNGTRSFLPCVVSAKFGGSFRPDFF